MTRVKLSVTLPEALVERVKTYKVAPALGPGTMRLSPSQVVEAALMLFFERCDRRKGRP